MPIKKRTTPNLFRDIVINEDAQAICARFIKDIREHFGADGDLGVAIAFDYQGQQNVVTNISDYDRLTVALQSIVAHRDKLGPVQP